MFKDLEEILERCFSNTQLFGQVNVCNTLMDDLDIIMLRVVVANLSDLRMMTKMDCWFFCRQCWIVACSI